MNNYPVLQFFALQVLLLVNFGLGVHAQTVPHIFLKNAHSHNDYTRSQPFTKAYLAGFGSIEVDLFLVEGKLLVAHELEEVRQENTFERLYLRPILEAYTQSESDHLYPQQGQLQLVIDLKSEAKPTLKRLTAVLSPYKNLFETQDRSAAVKIVISGNRPIPANYSAYDDIFWFDGRIDEVYNASELDRIGMISAPFSAVSNWNGIVPIPQGDRQKIVEIVRSVHQLGKTFRFWGSPDQHEAWATFLTLNIDFINTDQVEELKEYLSLQLQE